MQILKKRAEFVALAKQKRFHTENFTLQFSESETKEARFGFTVTKKEGNAVKRNRIKRRLKEAVRVMEAPLNDYVLIGRAKSLSTPFLKLKEEIQKSLSASVKKLKKTS